ncbi:MAG TPA: peptidase S15 [Gammaproteobacteria bacterium]|nr:peptidase S15 [Gammaproteobacteria bacterium]
MQADVIEIEHCWIPMSDGIRLSARLWLPQKKEAGPTPAIVEYIPYRKRDMVRLRDERNHPFFARHGYACIRVDMRGSGDSEGLMADMYSPEEINDGLEVIQWIAQQSWCNRRVGMMGTSWGGTSSLQMASLRPDSLKAVIAVCATDNRFDDDIHHMGGHLLTDTLEWGATLPAILAAPPDPETVGPNWRQMWQQRLDHCAFPLENWIRHEARDAYWRSGSACETSEMISCPILLIGGWVDRYSNTVMNLLSRNESPCWGIVGPWGHHYPDRGIPGPGIDFQAEALRWWDRWLCGRQNGLESEPKLRVWRQEYISPQNKILERPGSWISENQWPSPNVTPRTYLLGSGSLSETAKVDNRKTAFVPNSLQIGSASGDTGYFGRDGGLPLDQREDDALSLIFDTAPLESPLDILGHAVVNVTLEVDQPVATLVVRLNDVAPDATSSRVSFGICNLSLDPAGAPDNSHPSNSPRAVEIQLPNTAYRFGEGHRIRLAFSTSYWPMIWPPPKPVRMTLYPGQTRLSLPCRQTDSRESAVVFHIDSESERPSPKARIQGSPLDRWSQHDIMSNSIASGWHQPLTRIVFDEIEVEYAFETKAQHQITLDDLNSACSEFQHKLQFKRSGSIIELLGTTRLKSTPTDYHVFGRLEIRENDTLVCEREWNPVISRKYS